MLSKVLAALAVASIAIVTSAGMGAPQDRIDRLVDRLESKTLDQDRVFGRKYARQCWRRIIRDNRGAPPNINAIAAWECDCDKLETYQATLGCHEGLDKLMNARVEGMPKGRL